MQGVAAPSRPIMVSLVCRQLTYLPCHLFSGMIASPSDQNKQIIQLFINCGHALTPLH